MAGVQLLNPDQKQYVFDQLTLGTSYADISTAMGLLGVDTTWFDGLETAIRFAWGKQRAHAVEGPAANEAFYLASVTPTVTSISPTTFDTAAGQEAVIVGTGFVPGSTITIGGHAVTILAMSNKFAHVKLPAHAAEANQAIVVTAPNTNSGTKSNAVARAKQTPVFTSITPAKGKAKGGTRCIIVGTSFTPGMAVTIGGHACVVESQDSTHICIVTPAHAAGALDVVITAVNADAATGTGAYTYV